MFLTLEGQDFIINLNTIRNIEIQGLNLIIKYVGDNPNDNITLSCQNTDEAKRLFSHLLDDMSQHYPIYHANPKNIPVQND